MKKPHLTPQEINAHIHNTTTDADREQMDQHLRHCSLCRARLQAEQTLKAGIANAIQRQVETSQPSQSMNFAAIAEKLEPRSPPLSLQHKVSGVSITAGILLLALSFMRIGDNISSDSLPFLAYACFTLPIYTVSTSRNINTKQIGIILLSILLCLGIALLGLYEIYLIQLLAYRLTYFFSSDHWISAAVSSFSLMLAACGWVIAVIGNLDFQIAHRSDKNAWRLLRATLLIEGIILLLPLII
ncbi:MAG: hypothetical protein K8R40_03365 [Anaerolineaceae bacterium]|nr:hypothetical protein [Anaerolineaceae bacterium]